VTRLGAHDKLIREMRFSTLFKTFCVVGFLASAGFLGYIGFQPDVVRLRNHNPGTTALMRLRQAQARKAKVDYPNVMIWRDLYQISPFLVHAVLLSEDDRFYEHHGFDLEQIREAIRTNWREKRYAYGGSTITQQLARTLFLSPRKNIARKLKEAIITYRLERSLRKPRILELYLNVVEWGRGIYGAEAAAQAYFAKSASELTPDESVALASILPSPRRWSPISEKEFMARRRSRLLARLARSGYLPEGSWPGAIPPEPSNLIDKFPDPEDQDEVPPAPHELQGAIDHTAPEQL
jgi:monofunctional biosynthetic peptidoglycan transglycosylase